MAFTDNFTEASTTNLEDHTPSGGTDWALGGGATGAAIINATTDALRSRTTTASYYTCDDQGSADQYVQARLKNLLSSFPNSYICCRLVDASNFVGWRCAGNGSTGLRLSESVSGTVTDKYSFQGVDESVYRVEVNGTTAKIFEDGTQKGDSGGYTVGSSTETSQGLRIGSDSSNDWIDDFEAGSLSTGQTGTGSLTIAKATASGTGKLSHTGTGSLTSGAATAYGTGTLTHKGTGALTTLAATLAGAGVITHVGTGALTTAAVTLSGEGTVTQEGAVTGTGALTVAAITASGAGVISHTGTGSLQMSVVTLAGAGVLSHTGTGDLTTGATTVSGEGTVLGQITGTGDLTTGAVTLYGYDVLPVTEQKPGVGGTSTVSARPRRQKLIIVERVEDVEELLEQVEEIVQQEPKRKVEKKAKKPTQTVQEAPETAFDWLAYYDAQLERLRDQQRANALRRQLERNAEIIRAIVERQAQKAQLAQQLRDEEDLLLLLMAA